MPLPFKMPESWELVKLSDIAVSELGKTLDKGKNSGTPRNYLCAFNVKWCSFDFSVIKKILLEDKELERYRVRKGDLLICEGGDVGRAAIWESNQDIYYQNALHRVRFKDEINQYFYLYVLQYYKTLGMIDDVSGGVTIKHFTQNSMKKLCFPLPPIAEQKRIVSAIKQWFALIDTLETAKEDLQASIAQAKSKILDLAIHGKLVPQDPNDEPAIELLKRINPKFTPCDNGHYENVPKGWTVCTLEEIIDYEQPQAYIVQSTDYKSLYKTPVLTAGKSFIIGYTNESEGVYTDLPVIIFDDFTTDSKFVDFPFKVKSSAMKILHVKEEVNIQYVCWFMSITRLIGDTHKRYWISEYSKLHIPIPPRKEQDRIINKVNKLFQVLDNISAEL